jgi:hypothetical protein
MKSWSQARSEYCRIREERSKGKKPEELMDLYGQVASETTGVFREKWAADDPYQDEKQLGEFLDCFLFSEQMRQNDTPFFDEEADYQYCKKATRDFINDHEFIVARYKAWVDPAMIIADAIDSIIARVMEGEDE